MIPRAAMTRVGPFDERFFFGWEDVDYSLRLRLAGYRLLRVPSLFVYHRWGGSVSLARQRTLFREAGHQILLKWGWPPTTSVKGVDAALAAFGRALDAPCGRPRLAAKTLAVHELLIAGQAMAQRGG